MPKKWCEILCFVLFWVIRNRGMTGGAVSTVSDEQGYEQCEEHLKLCHLLEYVIVVILEGTEESVELYRHD